MEDRSPLCSRWGSSGGCRLDRDHLITDNLWVSSRDMFHFMQKVKYFYSLKYF